LAIFFEKDSRRKLPVIIPIVFPMMMYYKVCIMHQARLKSFVV
jgi:hypothetical protein